MRSRSGRSGRRLLAVVAFASSVACPLRSVTSVSARKRVRAGASSAAVPAATISRITLESCSPVARILLEEGLVLGGRPESELVAAGRCRDLRDVARYRSVDGRAACVEVLLVQEREDLEVIPAGGLRLKVLDVADVTQELAVGKRSLPGAFPSVSTRSFDWPSRRSPSTPRTTTSSAVPTNATSSLACTPAGTRPTARTSALSAGLSSRRFGAPAAGPGSGTFACDKCSDLQFGRAAHEVRDHPLAVDLRDVGAPCRNRCDLFRSMSMK